MLANQMLCHKISIWQNHMFLLLNVQLTCAVSWSEMLLSESYSRLCCNISP